MAAKNASHINFSTSNIPFLLQENQTLHLCKTRNLTSLYKINLKEHNASFALPIKSVKVLMLAFSS